MIPGSIGTVQFQVSDHDVFTWRNMSAKRAISFGEHSVMEGLPRLQHTGRKLDTISLPIVMDGMLPGATSCGERIDALYTLSETGEEQELVFGSNYWGLWVITAVEVNVKLMHGSSVLRADVVLSLTEYH